MLFGGTVRDSQNYSRMLTGLFVMAGFVASIGSVGSQAPNSKPGKQNGQPSAPASPGSALRPTLKENATKPVQPATAAGAHTKRSVPRVGNQRLVPPPPPSIPLATVSGGGTSSIPSNFQFMSKNELQKLQVKLKEQSTKAKTRLDDHQKRVQEQREKIELYGKLLQEGVVSRRDLENARNELDDLEARTPDLEEQVLRVTTDLSTIKKFLPTQKPQ